MSLSPIPIDAGRVNSPGDARWSLIERIVASPSFRKTARLKDLLYYLTEMSIRGEYSGLTEQHIGEAVFGKSTGYSPVEDSSVRVHIRQLRLKLHEYFDCEGRDEPLVVEIPKGGYMLYFRPVPAPGIETLVQETPLPETRIGWNKTAASAIQPYILWIAIAALSLSTFLLWQRSRPPHHAPWPLNQVLENGYQSEIVLSDSTYAIRRSMSAEPVSLESYMRRDFQHKSNPNQSTPGQAGGGNDGHLARYSADALLTSWADVAITSSLLRILPDTAQQITVRSARDLHPRDLEDGNFVFVGSPASNPWVLLFESRLNFREVRCEEQHESPRIFLNKHPKPGEQETYQGLARTGLDGRDYATIALLPSDSGRGNILLIQGLHQESTEGAGMLLMDEGGRTKLKNALRNQSGSAGAARYFEALLRIDAVGGSPKSASIVASRVLKY